MKQTPEEQEEKWIKAMRGEDDGLGAARGLWYAIRLVAGIVLGTVWVVNTITAAKTGAWESWLLGSFFLGAATIAFRWMEHHPQGRLAGVSITVAGITMFLLLLP